MWKRLVRQVLLVVSISSCRESSHPRPDSALAKDGPRPCSGVTGDYTNFAYAIEMFYYSDGASTFPNGMGYLGLRINLPDTNGGLNKIMLASLQGSYGSYAPEIWVGETITTALQDVLTATPDPVAVFARNVSYEWQTLDAPKQGVKLAVKNLSDLSFCYDDTLLNPY